MDLHGEAPVQIAKSPPRLLMTALGVFVQCHAMTQMNEIFAVRIGQHSDAGLQLAILKDAIANGLITHVFEVSWLSVIPLCKTFSVNGDVQVVDSYVS